MRERGLYCLLFAAAIIVLSACGAGKNQKGLLQQRPAPPPPLAALPLRSVEPLLRPPAVSGPDAVELLISRAESLYNAGMDDYREGNLDKAKEHFDEAISVLLGSNQDLQDDGRLKDEFHKLVEDIHAAEVAALERGDVLSVQKYEPAPIDSIAELTFPVDPNVKARVAREVETVRSDLPLISNDYVAGVINYFQTSRRGQGFIQHVLRRIGLYQPIISESLRKEGLPQELAYLAGAESAYNPFALSRAGAKGIWQLMLGRALEYGLKKDRWVDEREDPVKSTQAAARHLSDLYKLFGDWYLAMAAYNCGPVNVQKAVEKTGYADFWNLRRLHALPRETENYVPIILATALIAKDPKAFGFDVQPDPPVVSDQVVVSVPTDLRLIAQLISRPVEDLIQLNPSLLRWTTPANDPQFVLNLPPGTKETYEQAVASIPPDKRIWWRAYNVAPGETVSSIAGKFRISPVALAGANQIERGANLEQGARLLLPLASGSEASLMRVRERGPRALTRYRVRAGDSLELIADRFDVTLYQIRRWNKLKSSKLVPGRTLRLYLPAKTTASSRRVRAAHRRKPSKGYSTKKNAPSAEPRVAPRTQNPALR